MIYQTKKSKEGDIKRKALRKIGGSRNTDKLIQSIQMQSKMARVKGLFDIISISKFFAHTLR
ncbi:MAG TPA: hypothetical protein VKA98_10565 [Nitrososphaeraceae archaeon]|nr:hypothetical protein [Nitrososphaeraceae archaeon]